MRIESAFLFRVDGEPRLAGIDDAPFICPAVRGQLGVAIRTNEAEIIGTIIATIAVLMIKNQLERFLVPNRGTADNLATRNIASGR